MIEVTEETLAGVKYISLTTFADERGFFSESYRKPLYQEKGIDASFVQDNHSFSKKGTIRGMHFQTVPGQAKLVSVLVGVIYDVFVDIRPHSPTFGKWGARELDAQKGEQLYIPVGFAHGFAVLSDGAHVLYKVSSVYNSETEKTFRFDDPDVGIKWPVDNPIISERDKTAPLFKELFA